MAYIDIIPEEEKNEAMKNILADLITYRNSSTRRHFRKKDSSLLFARVSAVMHKDNSTTLIIIESLE